MKLKAQFNFILKKFILTKDYLHIKKLYAWYTQITGICAILGCTSIIIEIKC